MVFEIREQLVVTSTIHQCVIERWKGSNQCLCIGEFGEDDRLNVWLALDLLQNGMMTKNFRWYRWWWKCTWDHHILGQFAEFQRMLQRNGSTIEAVSKEFVDRLPEFLRSHQLLD